MDSFEWNKILGAILGTLLLVFIVNEVASIVFHAEEPAEEMAYKIEIPEGGAAQAGAEGKPEPVDFGKLLQQASAEQGETVAKRCLQCHSFEKGGANKTGPNLWGILGRKIASGDDFRYSNALSQMEGEWTYEKIYEFVGAPARWAPGTSMNFAGLRRQQQRIDLLAYLRTQADSPPPIPEPLPEEASAEEPEAPAAEADDAEGADAAAEGGPGEQPAGAAGPAEDAKSGETDAGAENQEGTPEDGAEPEDADEETESGETESEGAEDDAAADDEEAEDDGR